MTKEESKAILGDVRAYLASRASLENELLAGHSYIEICNAIKAMQEPKTKWISVSERLPENGQNVLFCDIDGDIMIGYHVKGRPNTHFSQDGSWDDIKNVRAWQPLPEPYKESEDKE